MEIGKPIQLQEVSKGGIVFNILDSGDIYTIQKETVQLNLLRGNSIEGTNSNLYLRIHDGNESHYTKLIGADSPSSFYIKENQVIYKGIYGGVSYEVILTVLFDKWFYDVKLMENNQPLDVEVFYAQDIAISDIGAVNNNEAYTCQYIDHKVFESDLGYVIASRQNQGVPHFLQQGSLSKNIAYSTDGFQFFGLNYKLTNTPKAMTEKTLESKNYQYEYALAAFQSEKLTLDKTHQLVFYGVYKDEIKDVATDVRFEQDLIKAYNSIDSVTINQETMYTPSYEVPFNHIINGEMLDNENINDLYPIKRHEETRDGELLSFFSDYNAHIVLQQKELMVERPHGNIAITGDNQHYFSNVMSVSHFMFGVFNSHVVYGNPSFHKMTSNLRSPLNTAKLSGQRIFIKKDGKYQMLGMPSLFEVGLNYSKWLYKFAEDIIIIRSATTCDSPEITMDIESVQGIKYSLLILNHVVMGANEYEHSSYVDVYEKRVDLKANEHAMCSTKHPDLTYSIHSSEPFITYDDSFFFSDKKTRNNPLLIMAYTDVNHVRLLTQGKLEGKDINPSHDDIDDVIKKYHQNYLERMNNFNLTFEGEMQREVTKFNDLALWYMHNALIHYASPHGLEQYSGAAWGTRDICQGPIEFFMSTQKYDIVREILVKLYSQQFIQNGDWPQWFMYDEYSNIQAQDSHGDIIVWPLRTLALYIEATNDITILDEKVPYTDLSDATFTEETYTIRHHIDAQLQSIENNFINQTYLSTYGGGDWDDTLQPANQDLTKNMVSGWTVALTYETFDIFSKVIRETNKTLSTYVLNLKESIKKDYRNHIIRDGVPAGFLLFKDSTVKAMLHPQDDETGLKYRLLPFNRGIISELFSKQEVQNYLKIIDEHLKYPDGVRLMDNTVTYKGGINTYFTRAETAANFGREISLQYVHAHIRYIEALARYGDTAAWDHLQRINPINIHENVPNAVIRQSNTYFSSSDGDFLNRYDAMNRFKDLKTGKVGVKGGWRIYSSGPGIYLNQLITNTLGFKIHKNNLYLDPVLPKSLNGLIFNYAFEDKKIKIKYNITASAGVNKVMIDNKEVSFQTLDNRYRAGGALLEKSTLNQYLNNNSMIEIFM